MTDFGSLPLLRKPIYSPFRQKLNVVHQSVHNLQQRVLDTRTTRNHLLKDMEQLKTTVALLHLQPLPPTNGAANGIANSAGGAGGAGGRRCRRF